MDTLIKALEAAVAELQALVKVLLAENMRLEDENKKLREGSHD